MGGQLEETFESWENPDGTVSEPFAARRAKDYFDRWASADLSGEHETRTASSEEMAAADATAVNNPKNVSRDIDNLLAQERMEADPAKKQALRDNILRLMPREESLAEAVVAHLVES